MKKTHFCSLILLVAYLIMVTPGISSALMIFYALIGQWIPFILPFAIAWDAYQLAHKKLPFLVSLSLGIFTSMTISYGAAILYTKGNEFPIVKKIPLNNVTFINRSDVEVFSNKFSSIPAGADEGCGCMYFNSRQFSDEALIENLALTIAKKQKKIYLFKEKSNKSNIQLIQDIQNKKPIGRFDTYSNDPNSGFSAGSGYGEEDAYKTFPGTNYYLIQEKKKDNLLFSIYKDDKLITSFSTPIKRNEVLGSREISKHWLTNVSRKLIMENSLVLLGATTGFPSIIFKNSEHPLITIIKE